MKLASLFFSACTVVFLSFPFILFYYAFLSGNTVFKDAVNNQVEFFYFLFMILAVAFATVVTKGILDRNKIDTNLKYQLLLLLKVTVVIYAIALVLISTSRFETFRSEAVDVGFFKVELTKLSAFEIPSYEWSQHFSPILFFLVPLFWLFKSGAFLMFIQAAFVVSGAIPLYLLVKEKLKSQILGLAIAISYLTFGGLQFGYAYGFHEIMFFPHIFFWSYYFLIKERLKLYFLFVLLCLFVKEEVSFIMIFWSIYLIYKKNYRYAFGTLALGILWYVLCFQIIFPYFNKGDGGYGYWGQYPNAEKGVMGIVFYALFHPLEFLTTMITPKYKIDMLFHTFGNFSFLSFLYTPSLIMVIPSLLQKLLSSDIAAKNGFHYSAAITAVVAVSMIESLFSILRRKALPKFIKNSHAFLGIIIMYVAVSANILYGYHPVSPLLWGKEGGLSDEEVMILNNAIASIPPNASVAAQYHIVSHINKPYWQLHDGPGNNETADYAIINTKLNLIMWERKSLEENVLKLINEGKYDIIVNQGGTILFKRKN